MKKLRKIENTFKSVLILKRINGQKRALNIQKRALNIRKGGASAPHAPPQIRHYMLLSSLLKVKFSGEFCSDIESISTILSAAWNKTNSSSQMFCFLGDFLGMVGVLMDWTLSHYDCRYWMYLPQHRSSQWVKYDFKYDWMSVR